MAYAQLVLSKTKRCSKAARMDMRASFFLYHYFLAPAHSLVDLDTKPKS